MRAKIATMASFRRNLVMRPAEEAVKLQRQLPDGALRIFATRKRRSGTGHLGLAP
jgi:hypothetical protein